MTPHTLLDRITSWWLAPMPAQRLGGVRIACGLYSLWYLWPRQEMLSALWRTDPGLFHPVGVAALLPGALPPDVMDAVYWYTIVTGILFTVGLGHRIVGPLFGLSLLFLLCYRNSWSMIFHMHNGLVVHALILGLTPAADGWSIDAFLKHRRGGKPPDPSWRYGWPVMLICAATTVVYFLSGVAKVAGPEGFAWATGESLRSQVAVNAIRYDVLQGESATLFDFMYRHTWLFWIMGIGTLVLELGAPLALANRRLGAVWATLTIGMHWGIYAIMGIKFRYQLSGLAFASFFDVEKIVPARFRR